MPGIEAMNFGSHGIEEVAQCRRGGGFVRTGSGDRCSPSVGTGSDRWTPRPLTWAPTCRAKGRSIAVDQVLEIRPVGKGGKTPAVRRRWIIEDIAKASGVPAGVLPVPAVTAAALPADHGDESLVMSEAAAKHAVDGTPVQLAGAHVGGDRRLEGPESNQRVGRKRSEELVQLGVAQFGTASGIGPPFGGRFVGVYSGEVVGSTVEGKPGSRGPNDGGLCRWSRHRR